MARGQLKDYLVFLNEIQLLVNEVLDHFRIVLQTVDGAAQAGVFLGQAGVFLIQMQQLLMIAVDLVEAPVAEEHHDQDHPPQDDDQSGH